MSVPSVKVRRFSRNKFQPDEEAVAEEQQEQEVGAVEDEIQEVKVEEELEEAEIGEEDFLAGLKGDAFEEPPPEPKKKRGKKKAEEQLPPLPIFEDDEQKHEEEEPLMDPFNPHQYDDVIRGVMREGLPDHVIQGVLRDGPPPARPVLQRGSRKGASGGGFKDLFGAQASPILGIDRRELLIRVKEYKTLFADIAEVKAFKIKEGATVEQLQAAVDELDIIVSSSGTQQLCDNMVLSAIRMAEAASSRTPRFDITGTADMLQGNVEFHRLVKQLSIRYRVFSRLPPEYQLALMITSTAMIARNANQRRHDIEGMLNVPL